MHQQAQSRLKKDEVEKLGAVAYVVLAMDRYRARVFKEENLLLSRGEGPFSKEKSLVFATALADPPGSALSLLGNQLLADFEGEMNRVLRVAPAHCDSVSRPMVTDRLP